MLRTGWPLCIVMCLLITTTNAQNIEAIGKTKAVHLSGSIGASYTTISSSDTGRIPMPNFWNINANLNIDLYGLSIPLTAIVSNGNVNFTNSFSQFGISPQYKWATLHLGYRQFNYSPFSVSGQTFLGAGFDLRPKKFRLGAFIGRLRKSTALDTTLFPQTVPGSYPLDVRTINGINKYSQQGGYERWGWGAKVGYGKETNFVDLILFKGSDREESISDTFSTRRLMPEQNVVVGLNTYQKIGKHITFGFNSAASIYTYNTNADTVSIDNVNVPLKGFFTNLIPIRATTQLQFAGDVSLGVNYKDFNIQTQFRRIEPYYRSMGINMFLSDLQSISIQPSWSLLKQKIRFTNSLQLQKDNLNGYKQFKTNRTVVNSSISINTSDKWGLDLNYNNYAMRQHKERKTTADSIQVFQHSNTFTIVPRYIVFNEKFTNVTSLVGSYTHIDGGGTLKGDSNKVTNFYGTINNTITLNKTGWNFSGGFNYNNAATVFNTLSSYGVIVGVNKSVLNNTLSISNNNTFLWNMLDGNSNGNTYSSDLVLNYVFKSKHNFSAAFNYLFSPANHIYNNSDFKQFRSTFSYQYNF